jgi:hypothetical protein
VPWERNVDKLKLKENGKEFCPLAAIGPAVHMNFSELLDGGWYQAGCTDDVRSAVVRRPALVGKNREPGNGKHYRLGIRSKRSTTQGDAWLLRLCTPHPTPSVCTKQRVRQLLLSTKPLARHCVRQKRSY